MFDLIEKLRQKPESSKKKIAFLTSFSLAGLIFVIWLSVIYPDFSFKEKQKQVANSNNTGMFSSFMSNISEGIGGIKEQLNSVKDLVSSISTSTHYTTEDSAESGIDMNLNSSSTQDFDPSI